MGRPWNQRRSVARAETMREYRALGAAAYAWLRSRGLWDEEICALARVHHTTPRFWRQDRGRARPPVQRMLALMRAAHGLPAWPDRKRNEPHPYLGVVARRMREA